MFIRRALSETYKPFHFHPLWPHCSHILNTLKAGTTGLLGLRRRPVAPPGVEKRPESIAAQQEAVEEVVFGVFGTLIDSGDRRSL